MSKKRGFTLVEVLVVIAISTIVMITVGSTFVFIATSSGDLIHRSEQLVQAQNIETYLRSIVEDCTSADIVSELQRVKHEDGYIKCDDKRMIDAEGLKTLLIITEQGKGKDKYFVKCTLEYSDGEKYDFILGISDADYGYSTNSEG